MSVEQNLLIDDIPTVNAAVSQSPHASILDDLGHS